MDYLRLRRRSHRECMHICTRAPLANSQRCERRVANAEREDALPKRDADVSAPAARKADVGEEEGRLVVLLAACQCFWNALQRFWKSIWYAET